MRDSGVAAPTASRASARRWKKRRDVLGHPGQRARRGLDLARRPTPCRRPRRAASVARAAAGAVAVAHQVVDPVVAERDAEVLGGHVLELVGLVHDQRRCTSGSPRRTSRAAPTASAHSRWWLTITTSDSAARWRISVTKHSVYCGHSVPRQVSASAEMWFHSGRSSGRSRSSARSPVAGARGPLADHRQEDRLLATRSPRRGRRSSDRLIGSTASRPPRTCRAIRRCLRSRGSGAGTGSSTAPSSAWP